MKKRKPLSLEHRLKLSLIKKGKPGRKHSEETKQKLRVKMLLIGNKPPLRKGISFTEEHKRKIGLANKGKKMSEEARLKMSKAKLGKYVGPKNPAYKIDRSQLAKKQMRNDVAYQDWRKQVWNRDKFKCRIADRNCSGRIEAHHILAWSKYPELRYQINNGITLCHAHHPRKRAEEKRLEPFFMELVSVSKV